MVRVRRKFDWSNISKVQKLKKLQATYLVGFVVPLRGKENCTRQHDGAQPGFAIGPMFAAFGIVIGPFRVAELSFVIACARTARSRKEQTIYEHAHCTHTVHVPKRALFGRLGTLKSISAALRAARSCFNSAYHDLNMSIVCDGA